MVNKCINNILDRVFQPLCPLCDTPCSGSLCRQCHNELPINQDCCQRCALPIADKQGNLCGQCLSSTSPISFSQIPFLYADPIDRFIGQFKFTSNLAFGRMLSQLWLDHHDPDLELPELLIPVPLHSHRLSERGYNQALELARPIASHFGIPIDYTCCKRILHNTPQSGLKKQQRKRGIRGAFEVKKRPNAKHISLVDDVVTTGSTVIELARQLKKSGVERIDVWAIARTP
ncbi:MAG: ComF family protein [Sedimenticola sp.]|nr:ComF family protein [Sedimenticola sp.]